MSAKRQSGGSSASPPPDEPASAESSEGAFGGPATDALRHEFEELGLSRYEAAVLVAVLRLGTAKSSELARVSGVPRTSTYEVLTALSSKGLVERLPGDGPAVWASPGRDEVLNRQLAALASDYEDRLRSSRQRAERVREMLAQTPEEESATVLPYVHVIRNKARAQRAWDLLLSQVELELLMYTRPPYITTEVNPLVVEMLERGVTARVLYSEEAVAEPDSQDWLDAYHDAGVQGRLVGHLPVKMIVVDRRSALVGMTHPSQDGYPTMLLIDHPGFAEVLADAFERNWDNARPYARSDTHSESTAESQEQ